MSKNQFSQKLHVIYDLLYETYGFQPCFLHHETPFQLLVAVILSAQCTDVTVNRCTPNLFKNFPTPDLLAQADENVIFSMIHSIGLFRVKTKYLIEMSRRICSVFQGEVPQTMSDLISLPGVGRKTANVILADAFGLPGFPVDTHVIRLSQRLGWVSAKNVIPDIIEQKVSSQFFDPLELGHFSRLLIIHGRSQCHARKPCCQNCILQDLCKLYLLDANNSPQKG